MVVVGAARSRSGGMVEEKVCSVAWQRQHVHHQQQSTKVNIKQAAQSGDSLPVVELKPFTKKVWRREKSLPNFYEKPPGKEDSGSETARQPTARPQEPPPNIVRYIRELSEQRKSTDTRQSVDSTQRYRSKLHPKAEFHFEGSGVASEHQQDLIPSFITRTERTRTTLGDEGGAVSAGNGHTYSASARAGSGAADSQERLPTGGILGLARDSSNLMSSYTRDKRLQQGVVLTGGKLPVTNLGRRTLHYLQPYSGYNRQQSAWNVMRTENSPTNGAVSAMTAAGISPRHAASLPVSPRNNVHINVLGTASANGHHQLSRKDLVLSGSSFHGPERSGGSNTALQPLRKSTSRQPHKFHSKLGAAQDSLQVLSRTGVPTVLEKVLSYDQEIRLERCRKERSFAAISETNVLSSAHYVAYDSQPTRGEMTLMKARQANKSRDGGGGSRVQGPQVYRRNGLQRPVANFVPHQGHPQFILAKVGVSEHSNSPRSTKSDLGDSGIMSSPGDSADGELVMGHPLQPHPLLIPLPNTPIPEHPSEQDGEEEEEYEHVLHAAEVVMWAPEESVVYVDEEVEVESTDPYQRPYSDSAANDTVVVRNEQTPLSADNLARKLPRQKSQGGRRVEHTRGQNEEEGEPGIEGVVQEMPDLSVTEDEWSKNSGAGTSMQTAEQVMVNGNTDDQTMETDSKNNTNHSVTEPSKPDQDRVWGSSTPGKNVTQKPNSVRKSKESSNTQDLRLTSVSSAEPSDSQPGTSREPRNDIDNVDDGKEFENPEGDAQGTSLTSSDDSSVSPTAQAIDDDNDPHRSETTDQSKDIPHGHTAEGKDNAGENVSNDNVEESSLESKAEEPDDGSEENNSDNKKNRSRPGSETAQKTVPNDSPKKSEDNISDNVGGSPTPNKSNENVSDNIGVASEKSRVKESPSQNAVGPAENGEPDQNGDDFSGVENIVSVSSDLDPNKETFGGNKTFITTNLDSEVVKPMLKV